MRGQEGRNAGSHGGPVAPGAEGGSAAEPTGRRSSRTHCPRARWSPPADSYFYRKAQQAASESTPDPASSEHAYSTRLRGAAALTMPSRLESQTAATASGSTPPPDGRATGRRSVRSTAEPWEGSGGQELGPGRQSSRRPHPAVATPEPRAVNSIAEDSGRVSRRSHRSGPELSVNASMGSSPVLADEQRTSAGRRGRRGPGSKPEASFPPVQSEGLRGTSPTPQSTETLPRLSVRINMRRTQDAIATTEATMPARSQRRGIEGQDRGTSVVLEPVPVPALAETRRSQRVPVPSHRVVSLSSLVESDGSRPAQASERASGLVLRLPNR